LVLAVAHNYRAAGWPLLKRLLKNGRGLVMDIKGVLDPLQAPTGVENWRL
jgi:UDP-N-acetyl-D-galactosamine dehydrogenase